MSPADALVVFSAGLIAFVFALSGALKLARPTTTMRAMRTLQVPSSFVGSAAAIAVALTEIALAAALLVGDRMIRQLSAGAAVSMLCLFTALLLGAIRRGENGSCNCFGGLSADERITGWSIARNAVLVATALAVVIVPSGTASVWQMLRQIEASALLGVALAWTASAVLVLLLAYVRLRRRVASAALPRIPDWGHAVAAEGDPIPASELVNASGVTYPLTLMSNGRPLLLVFGSAECGSCIPVLADVPLWQEQLRDVVIRIATSSQPKAIRHRVPSAEPFARYGSRAARGDLGIDRAPAAVLLGGRDNPVIASPVAYGRHEIEALVRSLQHN